MRDHGGDLDRAMAAHGGTGADWIDLSTGINRVNYPPLSQLSAEAWTALPTRSAMARLVSVARETYRTPAAILPTAGAQAAIQMIPRVLRSGHPQIARVVSPTYNEHAASLRAAGWTVETVQKIADLEGADLAVVVNPNNPDGRVYAPQDLLDLLPRVGGLVVDESFGDPRPDLSIAPLASARGLYVLKSVGKFYGLAGLRLGFVIGNSEDIAVLAELAGPWPVCGPAIETGCVALADREWAKETIRRLRLETVRLDALAAKAGWTLVGGCELFRTYAVPDAAAAQDRFAAAHIWTRVFPWSAHWVRFGLPGSAEEWVRLEKMFH